MPQPTWLQWYWASGRFPMALLNASVPAFVPFLWVDLLGLSVVNATLCWTIQSICAAIAGPLWGYALDNSNTTYGRYAPFHVILCAAWFLMCWGLFDPPISATTDQDTKFICYLVFLTAYGVFTVLGHIMLASSNYELFSQKQQESNPGLLQLFNIIGILLAQFPPVIATDNWSQKRNVALLFGFIASLLQFICMMSAIYGHKLIAQEEAEKKAKDENKKTPVKSGKQAVSQKGKEKKTFFSIFGPTIETLKNPRLTRTIFGNSVCIIGLTMLFPNQVKALLTFIVAIASGLNLKYVLKLHEPVTIFGVSVSPTLQGVILSAEPIILGLLATPLTIKLLKVWGVNALWQRAAAGVGLIAVGVMLTIPNTLNFLTTLVFHALLGIFVLPTFMMLPDILLGKVIDAELRTHPSQFPGRGAVLGTATFLVCLVNSLCGTIQAAVLTFVGYVQPTAEDPNPEQPPEVRTGIQFLLYGVPFLCFLGSAAIIPQLPLQKPIKELQRHQKKKSE